MPLRGAPFKTLTSRRNQVEGLETASRFGSRERLSRCARGSIRIVGFDGCKREGYSAVRIGRVAFNQ